MLAMLCVCDTLLLTLLTSRLRPSVYGGLVPDAEKWELAGGWLAAIFRLYGAQLLTPTPNPDASPSPNPNPNPNPDPDH